MGKRIVGVGCAGRRWALLHPIALGLTLACASPAGGQAAGQTVGNAGGQRANQRANSGAPPTSRDPVGGDSDGRRVQAARRSLPEVHAELEGLQGAAFGTRVEELLVSDPLPTMRALILRGGRSAVPGLTSTRAERRAARREEALAWIAGELQESARAGRWREGLRDLLAEGSRDENLLCAALSVVGRLGRYDLAQDVAWSLRGSHPGRVREVARLALFRLYGRWFADRAEFEAAWGRLAGKGPEELFLAEFTALQGRLDELELRLVERDPRRVATVFAEGRPELRARAATLVGRGVGRKTIDPEEARALLLARVPLESDPAAFHATLAALLELVGGLGPEDGAVVALRASLTDPRVQGQLQLTDARVEALSHLPWKAEGRGGGDGELDVRAAIRLCAAGVGELGHPAWPVDFDRLSVALDAFQTLCAGSGLELREVRAASVPATAVVRDLLGPGFPLEVRLAAARVVLLVAVDLPSILSVLEDSTPDQLRFVLLGPVVELAADLPPDPAAEARLLRVLEDAVASGDADLGRRALELMAGESLTGILARAEGRQALGSRLARGLAGEGSRPLAVLRFAALRQFAPNGPIARELLDLENLDGLLEGNHLLPEELVRTLTALMGPDAPLAMRAARRLAEDRRESPPEGAASPAARARVALALVAGLGVAQWAELGPADHGAVVGWATLLRSDAGDVAGGPDELAPWLAPLVGMHLVHMESSADSAADSAQLALLRARFSGDLHLADPTAVDRQAVLDVWAEAQSTEAQSTEAQSTEDATRAALALRGRARFLWAVEDRPAAGADYRALAEGGGRGILEPRDLRRVVEVLGLEPGAGGAAQAARAGLDLVRHPSWAGDGAEVRRRDLLGLLQRARSAGDPELAAQVLTLFEGLPAPAQDGAYPLRDGIGADRVYARLLEDLEGHGVLARAVQDLREGSQGPGPEEQAGGGDDGSGEGDGPPEGSGGGI